MTVVSLAHVKLSHARALVRWEGLKIYKEEDRAESCGQLSRSDRTRQNWLPDIVSYSPYSSNYTSPDVVDRTSVIKGIGHLGLFLR